MVNDTTTLNGALAELGETMAANITTKCVSASASDGLTTLAGKILQISGDTPTPTTVLFEDACSSNANLSHYATGIMYEGGSPSTITYDSTQNAYKVETAGKVNLIPITDLTNEDNFVFEADIKRQTAQLGIGVALSSGNGQGSAFSSNTMGCWLFVNGGFQNLGDTSVSTDTDWSHMKYTREGLDCVVVLTNSSDTTYTKTFTLPSGYDGVGYVGLVSGGSGYCYIKNIIVKSSGEPVNPCEQYQTEISNAITYINGSGS